VEFILIILDNETEEFIITMYIHPYAHTYGKNTVQHTVLFTQITALIRGENLEQLIRVIQAKGS